MLRSAPANFLIGKPVPHLSTARLPRGLYVLRIVQFYNLNEKRTLPVSCKLTCEQVITVWERARMPTQRIDSCVRKVSKLFERYRSLRKHRTREGEAVKVKEQIFKDELEELFDIATHDALMKIKNEEEKQFLEKQLEDVFSCSMSGGDQNLAAKESRKRQRGEKKASKARYKERETKCRKQEMADLSSTSSSQECQTEDEFQASTSTSSAVTVPSQPKKLKIILKSPEVVGALDRVNLPDRGAMFVVGAVAQGLGHNLSEMTLSQNSIRRYRRQGRLEAAAAEQTPLEGHLLLHWDGKHLPDIDGSKAKVDRIAVLVTGNGQEKLLGIPKIGNQRWNLASQIKGLVFDTTASNTGLHSGACIKIEEAIGTKLVWIACRHHVMEIILSSVFSCTFFPTGGPQTALNRFQKKWSTINKDVYVAATDKLFQCPILSSL